MFSGARVAFPRDQTIRTPVRLTLGGSPKIVRLRITSTSDPLTTFAGSFNLIDDQECFDLTFGSNTPQLYLTTPQCGAKQNLAIPSVRINIFISMCQVFIFYSLIKKQYVGSNNYDSHGFLSDAKIARSQLKMQNLSRGGKQHYINPNNLFREYLEYTTLLLDQAYS